MRILKQLVKRYCRQQNAARFFYKNDTINVLVLSKSRTKRQVARPPCYQQYTICLPPSLTSTIVGLTARCVVMSSGIASTPSSHTCAPRDDLHIPDSVIVMYIDR